MSREKLEYYRKLASERKELELPSTPSIKDELCTCGLGKPYDELHVNGCPAKPSTRAKAELMRLTALLEDRDAMAKVLRDAFGIAPARDPETGEDRGLDVYMGEATSLVLADRLIAYLKE